MSSISPRFGRPKLSAQPLKTEPVESIYASHHATVNCHECNRTMVPRLVSYYGQPLKSICPFCAATFMKFPSGLQRFLQSFHTRTLSSSVLKQLIMLTLGFVLLLVISNWGRLPDKIGLVAFFGAVIFGTTCVAELFYQCIEQLAAKFSHESNYYWASIVAIAMMTAITRNDLTGYIGLFFLIILLRGLVVGLIQFRNTSS